ncbi:MAG: hypothetical protein H8M99_08290 [Gloeobacteraceae cyanobacterium ES-bin-144]|nr:hypothetical protein [Verrucomicrobiales bacterium]
MSDSSFGDMPACEGSGGAAGVGVRSLVACVFRSPMKSFFSSDAEIWSSEVRANLFSGARETISGFDADPTISAKIVAMDSLGGGVTAFVICLNRVASKLAKPIPTTIRELTSNEIPSAIIHR